jgi:hypothetical protein
VYDDVDALLDRALGGGALQPVVHRQKITVWWHRMIWRPS